MASLALFCDQSTGISQAANKGFGIDTSDINKFRVNSIFNIAGSVKAYAMVSGTVLLQQQSGIPAKVNLILKPHDQSNFKLPIKYVVYRGLETSAFIENNNISDPNNKVKTTGSELLVAMQTIQQQRAPSDDIPIQALFGNELTSAATKNIDEFFFQNLALASQLFKIDCGVELGKFATGEISIEVILENPEYFLTLEDAKKPLHEINVAGLSSAEKKFKQDLVRHFVDPAAYYGLHHDIVGGIEYRTGSAKQSANTPALVYSQIVNKFLTKNKVYLDVRNENGYSYNYYGNYVGTGADANKNIKIGQTATTLVAKEYYTNGWAIHTIDVTAGSGTENEIFVALRVDDNERPLVAGLNTAITPYTEVDPPITSTNTFNRIYYVDETILIPTVIVDFTNPFSVKVPSTGGSAPTQLSTIIRIDYNKQNVESTFKSFALTGTTDYHFGTTSLNIPWDTDDTIKWHTDNFKKFVDAVEDIGFAGYIETGHIVDINNENPSNENILIYTAPENYLLNEGFEKQLTFNRKGGTANLESFINLFPDLSLERTNLMPSTTENILSFSLGLEGRLKKPIQFLGITKTEWETAINNANNSLSDNHIKLIKLNASGTPKIDINGINYSDFEIAVTGMNSIGNKQEIATGLTVYTTDNLFFATNNFAENYQIDYSEAEQALDKFLNILDQSYPFTSKPIFFEDIKQNNRTNEEYRNLSDSWFLIEKNKNLFFLDLTMKDKVSQFKNALDNVQNDYLSIETIVKQKGAELLNHAKQRIKEQNKDYTNKDGILYLTRLMMQVIIKNHPKLLTKFPSKITELSITFEKHSRGLIGTEKPDFSSYPNSYKKILIAGFDPFNGSLDKDENHSNSSGNLVLALDNDSELLANNIIAKTVIFPVRYKEFDDGWVEDFFESYVGDTTINMIITFSQSPRPKDFKFDLFASNFRRKNSDNLDFITPSHKLININKSDYNKYEDSFIKNLLPFDNLKDGDSIQIPTFNIPQGENKPSVGVFYRAWWAVKATNNSTSQEEYVTINCQNARKLTGAFSPTFDSYIIPILKIGTDLENQVSEKIKYYTVGNPDYINFPSWQHYPDTGSWVNDYSNFYVEARMGSGGDYLSNEIHYRVSYLRKKLGNIKPTGHIHMNFMKGDTNKNRIVMVNAGRKIIEKLLE